MLRRGRRPGIGRAAALPLAAALLLAPAGLGCATTRPPGAGFRTQVGLASFYSWQHHGKRTASGEIYNMKAMTAAHRTLPFGTRVKVTNLENGRRAVVRINDRGPFREGRIIDLSYGAALKLGLTRGGVARVRIQVL